MKYLFFICLTFNLISYDTFLYAPWRDSYRESMVIDKNACPFCDSFESDQDFQNLVLKRFSSCAIMVNRFPYAKGHLLVIPYRHVKNLNDLNVQEYAEIFSAISFSVDLLKKTFAFENFNIGINLGKLAGASIENHLHIHIVPRYVGEAGFQEILFQTRVINFDVADIYKKFNLNLDI